MRDARRVGHGDLAVEDGVAQLQALDVTICPLRLRSVTTPSLTATWRRCPSCLTSCSHAGPSGAMSAGEASIGRIHLGIAVKGDAPNGSLARRRIAIVCTSKRCPRDQEGGREDAKLLQAGQPLAVMQTL